MGGFSGENCLAARDAPRQKDMRATRAEKQTADVMVSKAIVLVPTLNLLADGTVGNLDYVLILFYCIMNAVHAALGRRERQ
jgi:hypothetical protein